MCNNQASLPADDNDDDSRLSTGGCVQAALVHLQRMSALRPASKAAAVALHCAVFLHVFTMIIMIIIAYVLTQISHVRARSCGVHVSAAAACGKCVGL